MRRRADTLRTRAIALAFAASVASGACSAEAEPCFALPEQHLADAVIVEMDLRYGDGERQTMDVFRPPGEGSFPALVLVHGGGFIGGDKSQYAAAARYYASRGIVAIPIQYTLGVVDGSRPAHPAAVQDVYCAIRALRTRSAELRIDPDRIALLGDSAGAALVNMVATGGDGAPYDGGCLHGEQTARVAAAISYYGPADPSQPISADPRAMVPLFGPNPDPTVVEAASPVRHVDAADPPFVLAHGTNDRIVLPAQSRALRDALVGAGVEVTLVELPGVDHGFVGDFEGEATRRVRCDEEALLSRTLRPGE